MVKISINRYASWRIKRSRGEVEATTIRLRKYATKYLEEKFKITSNFVKRKLELD